MKVELSQSLILKLTFSLKPTTITIGKDCQYGFERTALHDYQPIFFEDHIRAAGFKMSKVEIQIDQFLPPIRTSLLNLSDALKPDLGNMLTR